RSVERGQTVAASLQAPELFIIAENLTDMQVDTSIDESEIGRIRLGQEASFTVDAFPGRTFEGTVRQIRKAAQTVSNVVTYTVVVSAANPTRELLPGMTANVRIVTDRHNDVLKVPNAALRFKPAGTDHSAATPAAPDAFAPGPSPPGQVQRERLVAELQLTDSQKSRLDAIYAAMRPKFMAQREAPQAERQKLAERNRSELRAQIAEMLSSEQKAKYDAIIAESGERRAGAARGRIYILDENRRPKAIDVRLGLSDGTATEIISPAVKEGMAVITGTVQAGGKTAPSPRPIGPRLF
ncbi:MAG TPA: efflux RND transporter periplasmic adaptor subunit, partial [Burkholderiaceae bacterium]|nr:efflux RND transporter periplasmic adaptor subunit [Burkholderiaceae bacterium]